MSVDHTSPTHRIAFAIEKVRRPGRMLLRMLDGPEAPMTIEVTGQRKTVGRGKLADVQVDHEAISSVHFELRATDLGVEVHDLDSTNGLWFRERAVSGIRLRDGDSFRAGRCKFVLLDSGEREVELVDASRFGLLCGESVAMRELYRELDRLRDAPVRVLLEGETGTGKELTAKTLHGLWSEQRGSPFVTLDCGCLTSELAEAKLFGVCKGAFTGAVNDREGVFVAAAGGTLFLDEIGELPLTMQVKLLRVLEDGLITRVGEATPSSRVDVRVIAATNRDLRKAVREGRFRADLYHRLAQVSLRLPALREREGDVFMLAKMFMDEVAREREMSIELAPEARAALGVDNYGWPGNVRELRNAVATAAYLTRDGTIVREELRLGDRRMCLPDTRELIQQIIQRGVDYQQLQAIVNEAFLRHLHALHGPVLVRISEALGKSREKTRSMLEGIGLYPWR